MLKCRVVPPTPIGSSKCSVQIPFFGRLRTVRFPSTSTMTTTPSEASRCREALRSTRSHLQRSPRRGIQLGDEKIKTLSSEGGHVRSRSSSERPPSMRPHLSPRRKERKNQHAQPAKCRPRRRSMRTRNRSSSSFMRGTYGSSRHFSSRCGLCAHLPSARAPSVCAPHPTPPPLCQVAQCSRRPAPIWGFGSASTALSACLLRTVASQAASRHRSRRSRARSRSPSGSSSVESTWVRRLCEDAYAEVCLNNTLDLDCADHTDSGVSRDALAPDDPATDATQRHVPPTITDDCESSPWST